MLQPGSMKSEADGTGINLQRSQEKSPKGHNQFLILVVLQALFWPVVQKKKSAFRQTVSVRQFSH
jgi:hypothetical protein